MEWRRHKTRLPWWRHKMETFSALPAIFARNSPVTGEFPTQRPVMRNFCVFFDLCLNKRLNKQWWGCWFETPSCPFDVTLMINQTSRVISISCLCARCAYREIVTDFYYSSNIICVCLLIVKLCTYFLENCFGYQWIKLTPLSYWKWPTISGQTSF